jgi:hypothetical protein
MLGLLCLALLLEAWFWFLVLVLDAWRWFLVLFGAERRCKALALSVWCLLSV